MFKFSVMLTLIKVIHYNCNGFNQFILKELFKD